jgi:hypothetical protein
MATQRHCPTLFAGATRSATSRESIYSLPEEHARDDREPILLRVLDHIGRNNHTMVWSAAGRLRARHTIVQ